MSLLALAALSGVAFAGEHRLAASWSVGGDVEDVAITSDGAFVGAVDGGAGVLALLDTVTFADPTDVSACPGAAGVAVTEGDGGWIFWVGCQGGDVVGVRVDAESGEAALDEALTLDAGEGDVLALETDGELLWALVSGDGNPTPVALDPATGTAAEGFDALGALGSMAIADTVVVSNVLVVVHGNDDVSKIDFSTGSSTMVQEAMGIDLVDGVAVTEQGEVWLADAEGSFVTFLPGSNDLQLGATLMADMTGLGLDEGEDLLWVSGSAGAEVYSTEGGAPGSEPLATIADAVSLTDVVAAEGYAYGVSEAGTLDVLTDRPWVTVSADVATGLVDGDAVTLTIGADVAGTWRVELAGDTLAEGDVDAGGSATATLTVGEAWAEGGNRVSVFVTDDAGAEGHAGVVLAVDNPPARPGIDSIGFGEERLELVVGGISDEDLDKYLVYVSDAAFETADWPTGGPPDFDVGDALALPIEVAAAPGEDPAVSVYPLQNDVTYYVAVRAIDANGGESPMSDVRSATPSKTWSAAELAGEDGGFCGVADPRAAGLAGLLLAGMAAAARRRRAALAVVPVALALAAPSAAQAAPPKEYTPRTSSMQVRVGSTQLTDDTLNEVFGSSGHTLFAFDYAWSRRFLEVGVGTGWMREEGWQVSTSGDASVDADNLTLIPFNASITGRLEIFPEQFLVPFGRIGGDATLFLEDWDVPADSGDQNTLTGMKYGWHYGGGLALLLDTFDRGAASTLEARTGINDTYVVAEYRKTNMLTQDEGFDLSRQDLTFGLKFDF